LVAIALVGAVLGILIRSVQRQQIIQLLGDGCGVLITFISIRFSNEVLSLNPTSFGAFISGLTYNEIALDCKKIFE
jgi:hypothetical protein